MKSLEESVVTAMDGVDIELFPFLPYILQDIWEIGADPEIIIELVRKNRGTGSNLSLLDLGCGKGAVSIKCAKVLKFRCLGIDAIKEFINEAKEKARENGVENLCIFELGDIRERIKGLSQFDIIVLGAIGPVFGNYYSTLTILAKCLNNDGIIIIDDGYIENQSNFIHPIIQKQDLILKQIKDSGMQIIDEVIIDKDSIKASDDVIFENIKLRCNELIEKHPDKRWIFENYIKKQEEENNVLETKVVCSTIVIKNLKHELFE
jgi:2-polyprenyl-3-methyl-5-hydroxy-6-metoxy-1,4-benzoquinol methylase